MDKKYWLIIIGVLVVLGSGDIPVLPACSFPD